MGLGGVGVGLGVLRTSRSCLDEGKGWLGKIGRAVASRWRRRKARRILQRGVGWMDGGVERDGNGSVVGRSVWRRREKRRDDRFLKRG